MVRTTVMLPEETHARLRRLARQRGIPLARLIREALVDAAESELRRTPSFIASVSSDVQLAAESLDHPAPITPPVSQVSDAELDELRRRFAPTGREC